MRGFLLRIPQGIEIQTYSTQKTGPQKRMYETLTEREKNPLFCHQLDTNSLGVFNLHVDLSIFPSKRSKQKSADNIIKSKLIPKKILITTEDYN